ncbi:protein Smaug homolog 2 [Ciona intestinalis]
MLFSDQVEVLATWFKNWNECEQTVALYSLLKRVKKCQAKFLARCLEHFLTECGELIRIEEEANDHEYLSRLFNEPRQSDIINNLLNHLPLLRPGNEVAKNKYLEILPVVLAHSVERSEYLEESRQLLSYSLIHPAFDNKERNLLTSWMSGLNRAPRPEEEKLPPKPGEVPSEVSSTTNSLEMGHHSNGLSDWNHNSVWEDSRSPTHSLEGYHNNSISPPSWQQESAPTPGGVGVGGGVSASNSLDNSQVGMGSNDSVADGMADVRSWLKTLRLHKYADLFSKMSYTDMMMLTEDKLDEQNVTKGARNKIILSIKKLHERFKQLHSLENEILGGGSLRSALLELKSIIQTPIKSFQSLKLESDDVATGGGKKEVIEEGDIPAQYTRVMGKACTQLLVSKPDEENITLYMKLLERCIQHPAFTETQKRRLRTWRQQVTKIYRSLPRNIRPPGPQRSQQGIGYPGLRRPISRSQFAPHMSASAPRALNQLSSPPMRGIGINFQPQNVNWLSGSLSAATPQIDSSRKAASLDPRLGQRMFGGGEGDESPNEINTRLDSLCLSVAEHALADGMDGISTL